MLPNIKKRFIIYRIIGNINNGITILFLLNIVYYIFSAGFQPPIFILLFCNLSMLIYFSSSLVFGRNVLNKGSLINKRIRDWIKVNALVTFISSTLMILLMISAFSNWNNLKAKALQNKFPVEYFQFAFSFLFISFILFIVHVLMTWYYLKKFNDHFI